MSADKAQDNELPAELWHYTTAGGLHGILQDQQLYGTHAGYLNDSQEFLFGMGVVVQELRNLADNPPPEILEAWRPQLAPEKIKLTIQTVNVVVAAIFAVSGVALRQSAGPYVSCLSAERDQLSQWRGYGVGGGYAIRFDPTALQESLDAYISPVPLPPEATLAAPMMRRRLLRMEYETTDQTQLARSKLITFLKTVAGSFSAEPQDPNPLGQQGPAMLALQIELLDIAIRLKHRGFREEREYRIVTFTPPEFFSPSNIGLIPRVNVTFDPGCVKEVLIGPGQHMDTRETSVQAYFQKHQNRYPGVEVNRSETPFTCI
jgi:hypothetical protein